MAMYGSTWREHPFSIGNRYIAKTDLPSFTHGDIQVGRTYELRRIGYSHYDGATVFTFVCLTTKALASWWWFDTEPESLCVEFFKRSA